MRTIPAKSLVGRFLRHADGSAAANLSFFFGFLLYEEFFVMPRLFL
jgi:hypothetical protein